MRLRLPSKASFPAAGTLLAPVLLLLIIAAWGTSFFVGSHGVLEDQTRSRLMEIASVAALHIDGDLSVKVQGPKQIDTPAYRTLVAQLSAVRAASPLLRAAYILRATNDPEELAFVADAAAVDTFAILDTDGDGIVEESERAALPGELYSLRNAPAMRSAFQRPSADPQITEDQWGKTVSGYAPVRDSSGRVVAILGVDMSAEDFVALSRSIFSPVAFLLAMAGAVVLSITLLLASWRRRIAALEELEHERSALLDLLLHQLGAPMATFKWWLEIFRERGECRKHADVCRNFEESAARMTGILAALGGAQRAAKKGKREAAYPVAVRAVLTEIVQESGARAALRSQRVRLIADPSLGRVKIDRDAFAAVVRELLDNAQSYSKEGTAITVRAWKQLKRVHISVEDKGCGITPADLPHIGERFVRGTNAYKQKPVGNGLGLFIAKRIIERAGGTLKVESELERGTTVTLVLPLTGA